MLYVDFFRLTFIEEAACGGLVRLAVYLRARIPRLPCWPAGSGCDEVAVVTAGCEERAGVTKAVSRRVWQGLGTFAKRRP